MMMTALTFGGTKDLDLASARFLPSPLYSSYRAGMR